MAKIVTINDIEFRNVTGFKSDEDTNASTTDTFDGPITQGSPRNPFSISIDRLVYENQATYIEMRDCINDLRDNPGIISVSEDIYPKNEEPFTITKIYHDCILDGNSYEIKPEEASVIGLKFKAASMEELPAGE